MPRPGLVTGATRIDDDLEHRMENAYQGTFPQYFGRYIDDCLGIASLPKSEVLAFIDFANTFHPAIRFTLELSLTETNFLDINIQLSGARFSTSVFYKSTDAHSYLEYFSSHSLSTKKQHSLFPVSAPP